MGYQIETMECTMRVLSLFSGAGGFDMGLEQAGWKTVFQCEIDKQCQRVLNRHWPDVPKWDDVSTLTGEHILEHTGGVDAVAWGSPCQDLSLAGRRKGLVGDKSSLFHEGIRIIKELQELTNGQCPTISIWENVAGAFSSNNGADFETVLCELADCRCHHLEWSVLDAQFFGVPQRRRRVFVISVFDLGIAKRCDGQILAVSKSGRRRTQTRESQRKSVARSVADSVATDSESVGMLFPALMDGNRIDDIRIWDNGVSPTLAAKMGTGGNNVPFVVDESKPIFIDFAAMHQGPNALYDPIIDQRDVSTCLPAGLTHAVAQFNHDDATVDPTKPFFIDVAAMYQGPASTFEPIIDQRDVTTSLIATFPHSVAQFPTGQKQDTKLIVRRLTPKECERLMGWPDDHTRFDSDGKEIGGSNRYKMCGNGVASPVARWIAEQINIVMDN
jgi:DNA (cytosine-5)-methyltransferase 1